MNKFIKTVGLLGTAVACTAVAYAKSDKVRKGVDSMLDKATAKLQGVKDVCAKGESDNKKD